MYIFLFRVVLDVLYCKISKIRKCWETRNTCQNRELYSRIYFWKNTKYIIIMYPNRIVPIIRTKGIFNIDKILIFRQIIVKNFSCSIDNWKCTICYINPSFCSFCISHIICYKENVLNIFVHWLIGFHCKVIRKYYYCGSLEIFGHYLRRYNAIFYNMDSSLFFIFIVYFLILNLFIVFLFESWEDGFWKKNPKNSMDWNHISRRYFTDHIDLIWGDEFFWCDDSLYCFDSRKRFARRINRRIWIYSGNNVHMEFRQLILFLSLLHLYLLRHKEEVVFRWNVWMG